MKILLVSNMYPSKNAPNYGVFVKNSESILLENGINIKKIVMYKEGNKLKKIFNYLVFYLKIILASLFKNFDYIYVHYASHNALPLILSKNLRKNINIVTNVHGSDVVPETTLQMKMQFLVRKLLSISNKIIVPSNYYKNKVSEKYSLNENKIYIFPSGGVSKTLFFPIHEKSKVFKELNLDIDFEYIGYVGRIDYKKGWDTLLEAIKLLDDGKFFEKRKVIIVGNGKEYNTFKQKISELQINRYIQLYSFLPQEKLNTLYNVFDVFCFPTKREGESLGLVGLEAMACGAPVIGSRIGGLKDYIIDKQNGLFFSTGNSEDLKNKIKLFFSYSDGKKREMELASIKTAENYTPEKTAKDLLEIFK